MPKVVEGREVARRPEPEPLETDDRWVVLAGVVAWVVAFVVLLVFFRDDLRRHHSEWWLWSCLVGVGLGGYGWRFVTRRQAAIARSRAAAPDAQPGQEWPNGSVVSESVTDPGS